MSFLKNKCFPNQGHHIKPKAVFIQPENYILKISGFFYFLRENYFLKFSTIYFQFRSQLVFLKTICVFTIATLCKMPFVNTNKNVKIFIYC
jgi:hypothetical protein